jgi:aryl-alcohol dehydrogenase-like predicted oxidoreductase
MNTRFGMASTEGSALTDYRTLGKSGLKVAPLTLGTMGFGWWQERTAAREIFTRYLEAGGNVLDTADFYAAGRGEEWVGELVKEARARDRVVLSTKFSFNAEPGNPNAGGNGRKNMRRALEASLRRLQTEYVDLYYVHLWDRVTPVEEVLSTLNDLVREGKVLHIGMSNVPAWYLSRAQTLAELSRFERVSALQLEYSLLSRQPEREHLPLARELGIALCPFHPLASGFLSGRYQRAEGGVSGQGRVRDAQGSGNPIFEKFTSERSFRILAGLIEVATELERAPAEVALNWIANRPGVGSTIIGATTSTQLEANLKALDFSVPSEASAELERLSAPEESELDPFFGPTLQGMVNGGTRVRSMYGCTG